MGSCACCSNQHKDYEVIHDNLPPLTIYELLDLLVYGYIRQQITSGMDAEIIIPDSILILCRSFFGIYGKRLESNKSIKTLELTQKYLQHELDKYSTVSEDLIKIRAKEIKTHVVNNGVDPMFSEDNPFKYNPNDCPAVPGYCIVCGIVCYYCCCCCLCRC